MLSKLSAITGRLALRNAAPVMAFPQRMFVDKLGLEGGADLTTSSKSKEDEMQLWEAQAKREETALVLQDRDEIEQYCLSLVRNYFRTTKKASISLDSMFADHGLDSLDAIELVIQVEDELGYVIDAENLEKFKKPKHFANFITHMEAYRKEFNKLPTDDIHA